MTHENGFTQSTDPFPDDTGNGLTILPANPPGPPLAYSGTLTNPGIGESSATSGGSYKISPGPVNFNLFEFIPPVGNKFTLSQTDLSANPNGPAVAEGTLAVPVTVVSGAGDIEVFSDFDIVTTIKGAGSVSIELNICSIKNWLDAPATDFPKTQADCIAEGGTHDNPLSFFTTVTGTNTFPFTGTHKIPVTVADAGNWWWLLYFLDVEVTNDTDPTEVSIENIQIEVRGTEVVLPTVSPWGFGLMGALLAALGAAALLRRKRIREPLG